jgi:glutamate dehydrogenase/leucine dehydrogenase
MTWNCAVVTLRPGGSKGAIVCDPRTMTGAFNEVHDRADRKWVPVRDAAYPIANERAAPACGERGWV